VGRQAGSCLIRINGLTQSKSKRGSTRGRSSFSVLRIQTAYNALGDAYLITTYNAASGGSIVNQVEDIYNGLNQLIQEYQSHSGAVVTGTTPSVQYSYTEMSGGQSRFVPIIAIH